MGMFGYLMHMMLAVLALFIVQLPKRNIAKNGNLKQPVAFLPYISLAFGLNIVLNSSVLAFIKASALRSSLLLQPIFYLI